MKRFLASRLWEENRLKLIDIIVLLALGFFLYMWGNHLYSLFDNSEPHYARVAQELSQHTDKLNLTFNGSAWYVHPPLYFWISSAWCTLLGWTDANIRFWEALFGIFGLVSLYAFGTTFFNRKTGLLASLILGSSLYYIVISRVGVFDTLLNTFILTSCCAFLAAIYTPEKRGIFALLGGVSTGLAVLTKGPIGWIHPGIPILIFLALTQNLKILKDWRIIGGILLSFLIGAPWYVHQLLLHGKPFFDIALKDYTWYRFFDVVEGQTGKWYFYLPVLLSFFPWIFYSPLTLMHAKDHPFWKKPVTDPLKGIVYFSWIFILFTFFFFSAAQTKLPSYILTLFPFLSLLIAHAILHAPHHQFAFKRASMAISFTSTMLAAMAWTLHLPAPYTPYHTLVTTFFVILAVGNGLAYIATFHSRRSSIGLQITTMVVATYFLTQTILPQYEQFKTPQLIIKTLPTLSNEDTLICINSFSPALKYYLNRNIPDVHSVESALDWSKTHPNSGRIFWVVSEKEVKTIPPELIVKILTQTVDKQVLIELHTSRK